MTSFKRGNFLRGLSSLIFTVVYAEVYANIMPDRCAVFGCSNEASLEKGISLHRIPFVNDDSVEAKKRRKRWVDFVNMTRDKWTPSINSAVCSEHFTPESFQRRFACLSGQTKQNSPRLVRDEIGVVAFPTIRKVKPSEQLISSRDRRMVSI